jgi:hypothetical protein
MKCAVIPVIIGATGISSKGLKNSGTKNRRTRNITHHKESATI